MTSPNRRSGPPEARLPGALGLGWHGALDGVFRMREGGAQGGADGPGTRAPRPLLEIEVLGGLSLSAGGRRLPLPASRKARALLAHLVLSGRRVHREVLVDMFWDGPDDPRAALRSALWKLRRLVDGDGVRRLVTDGEWVAFASDAVRIDLVEARAALEAGDGDPERLRRILGQPLLPGLDLPHHPAFQVWLVAEREAVERLRARLVGPGAAAGSPLAGGALHLARQRIGFARARDGTRIAWARIGEGPPLVKAANWLNHLELDWNSPIWSPLFQDLARDHCLIRYDERGNGMSDREVADLGFEAFVTDLACVADAAGHRRFPLLGLSQGVAVAIAYAVRHPERVSHLLLWGGYACGWRVDGSPELRAEREAILTLVARGWGRDDPAYRHIFSSAFLPGATPDELAAFDEFQRHTTSAANAVRFLNAFAEIDVRHELGEVRCPTLVMHARGDRRVPLEKGVELAAGIPGAEFVALPTDNHLLLGREPASALFLAHVRAFLAAHPDGQPG